MWRAMAISACRCAASETEIVPACFCGDKGRSHSKAGVQVLSKALDVWGLTCDNLMSEENRDSAAHPERENAFICNLKVAQRPWLSLGSAPLLCRKASTCLHALWALCGQLLETHS